MNRRDLVLGASGAVLAVNFPHSGPATPRPVQPDDERFMRLALAEAAQGDFPFGAVIVRDGDVLAAAFNTGLRDGDPTAHGEMNAIRAVLAGHGAAALAGATLYTSGEPCPMCAGAIIWCGIGRVVYAASIAQLATKLDQIMITIEQIAAAAPFAPLELTGGVLSAEAIALFLKP
ncbi:MAG: nucleoside deaminase [Chloroflexota bacterium]|nr:nucleoside deaminase [Chloroflexota bacterium]